MHKYIYKCRRKHVPLPPSHQKSTQNVILMKGVENPMVEKKEISDPDTLELCGIRVAKIVDLGIFRYIYIWDIIFLPICPHIYSSVFVFTHSCMYIQICIDIFTYIYTYTYT
jgi:hypothetical protein